MATQPKWVEVLCAVDGLIAAALFVVGVYLLDTTIIDFGWYAEPGHYAIVGGYLIYHAAVLLYASAFGARRRAFGLIGLLLFTVAGAPALIGLGAIDLVIAYQALFTVDPPRVWGALLAVPGLLAFANNLMSEVQDIRARIAAEADGATPTADAGKVDVGEVVRAYAWAGLVGAIVNAFALSLMMVGFFVYVMLNAIIIGDIQVELDYAIGVAFPSLFARFWPFIVIFSLLFLVGSPLLGLLHAWLRVRERQALPGIDRNLSDSELAFVARCLSALEQHIDKNGYRPLAAMLSRFDSVWFVLLLVATGVFVFEAQTIIAALYRPQTAETAWSFYVVDDSIAILAAVLLAFAWWFAPAVITSRLSRRLAEARTVIYKHATAGTESFQKLIIDRMRTGAMSESAGFDPGAFLLELNASRRWSAAAAIAVVTAAVFWVWPHERAMDTLYTANGIETGDFWTTERKQFAYSEALSVDLECSFNRSSGKDIAYIINLPGDRARDLLSRRVLVDRLDDLLRVDDALRKAGVEFAFSTTFEPYSGGRFLSRECVLALAEDKGLDVAKLETLFHIDEWQERRWKERISPPLVSSN